MNEDSEGKGFLHNKRILEEKNYNTSFFNKENCNVCILLHKRNLHFVMCDHSKIMQVGNPGFIAPPCHG